VSATGSAAWVGTRRGRIAVPVPTVPYRFCWNLARLRCGLWRI